MTSRSEMPLGAPAPTAAIVALVAVVATLLTAVVRNRPGDPSSPPTPEEPRLANLPEPEPEPATVLALVDAIPWGRLVRIESAAGDPHELPEPRETPVLLRLPAGTWRVSLRHPAFTEERQCEFTLVDGERHDCLVEFERVTVDQYFRETGWWR